MTEGWLGRCVISAGDKSCLGQLGRSSRPNKLIKPPIVHQISQSSGIARRLLSLPGGIVVQRIKTIDRVESWVFSNPKTCLPPLIYLKLREILRWSLTGLPPVTTEFMLQCWKLSCLKMEYICGECWCLESIIRRRWLRAASAPLPRRFHYTITIVCFQSEFSLAVIPPMTLRAGALKAAMKRLISGLPIGSHQHSPAQPHASDAHLG